MGLLHCSVISEPPATLELSHDGLILASTPGEGDHSSRFSVFSTPNSLNLEIRDLGPADSGQYTCSASNALGNSSSTLDFHAKGETGTGGWGRHPEEEPCSGLPPRSPEDLAEGLGKLVGKTNKQTSQQRSELYCHPDLGGS